MPQILSLASSAMQTRWRQPKCARQAEHCAACLLLLSWELLLPFKLAAGLLAPFISSVHLSGQCSVCLVLFYSLIHKWSALCLYLRQYQNNRQLFGAQALVCSGSELVITAWHLGTYSSNTWYTGSGFSDASCFSCSTVCMVGSVLNCFSEI